MTNRKLCECGCGEPTPPARRTRAERGWVKGQPTRFVPGHERRVNGSSKSEDPVGEVEAKVTVGSEGGEFSTGQLDDPLDLADGWDEVLRSFGLDPAVFEVVDDTVRMSKWQQSKRLDNGHRDLVWLYSYRARFRRRPERRSPAVDVDELRSYVRSWTVRRPEVGLADTEALNEAPCTFVVGWADWQLGKSAGGGVEATVAKIRESFELAAARLEQLRRYRNVERVAVVNMGDPTESCYGQYASQLFTVELTQREQLNLALDLWLEGVRMLRPDVFASVLSNHGEWTRTGAGERPVTSDSDSVDGYLADTLRRVLDGRPECPSEWHIPGDNMVTAMTLSDVPVAAAHGHRIKSLAKEREWLTEQSTMLRRRHRFDPEIWLTAHYHHLRVDDCGPWWRIQHPTLDGGSKWFEDQTGQWSTPGTATYLVGRHDVRGWSDLAVLGTRPAEGVVA